MMRKNHSFLIFLLVLLSVLVAGAACKKAPPPKPLPPVNVAPKKEAAAKPAPAEAEEKKAAFRYQVTERNPFGSLLRVKKVAEDGVPEELLTPLQRIPVNEMRVESIIVSKKRSVAHIITPDGKAHIASVGTPIGRHKGRIVRILLDEVIVEEQFEDYLGRAFKQETTLRLREKEGENL